MAAAAGRWWHCGCFLGGIWSQWGPSGPRAAYLQSPETLGPECEGWCRGRDTEETDHGGWLTRNRQECSVAFPDLERLTSLISLLVAWQWAGYL